jgi:hypothetical protein
MEQTYALSAWLFTRALSLVYLVAFLSLLIQAKGLWGSHGVMPMAPFLKAVEQNMGGDAYWQVPSFFWLSSSDDMLFGAALTGALAAAGAFLGIAQGWSLLLCWILYLSYCSSGQEFMSFQWDALLCEVGFLALFAVPWNFDFTFTLAREPHWLVRGMFYFVLFKLMFLSGVVKLLSGDESWRDLSALSYHYWTQPLPNPVSPFMNALPLWAHQASTALTFLIELVAPFFMLWPRARAWVALVFALLSGLILLTGNYTFFNWLTLALCVWLVPDGFWSRIIPFSLQTQVAPMFPHPVIVGTMTVLAALSLVWCARFWLPESVLGALTPVMNISQIFHISSPYGLFANMTKTRPEIVIEGSADGNEWKEYEFKYKPGALNRPPPVVAPYQPRLDWQMWFAALGTFRDNPWVGTLLLRLFENSPDVTEFFSVNPFAGKPPQYLRARLYEYEFTDLGEIFESGKWWKRELKGEYVPIVTKPALK